MIQHLVTTHILELLHMDLMGPMQVESIKRKRDIFVCVDDFSRYCWVYFIREKSYTFGMFEILCIRLRRDKYCKIGKIVQIRSDRERELENSPVINTT